MKINQIKSDQIYKICDYIILIFFILMVIGLYKYNLVKYWDQNNDSAGFVGLIESIKNGHNMVIPVFTSFYSYIPFLAATPDIFCNSDLPSLYQETSFLRWHPYFIAYPIAWFSELLNVSALNISCLISAINYSLSLYIIYMYLRNKNLNPLISGLFIISLIFFNPTYGYIEGQFYYDRLMLFPCIVMTLTLFDNDFIRRFKLPVLILTFITCLVISERTALISSLIFFSFFIINFISKSRQNKFYFLLFGFIGVIYLYFYFNYFQNSHYYTSISLHGAIYNIFSIFDSNKIIGFLTIKWLIVLSPFLFLCIFEYRLVLIVLMCLAPNLLVTVGGAEKVGFLTHYHAVYLPVLISVSAMGYVKLSHILGNKIYIYIIIISVFNLSLNITEDNKVKLFDFKYMHQNFKFINEISNISDYTISNDFKIQQKKNLLSLIPLESKISLPENLMPAAVAMGFRNIDYFPIGINSNDYIIVTIDSIFKYIEVTTYLGKSDKVRIEKCVNDVVLKRYIELNFPKDNYSGPYHIFKRVK